MTENQAMQNLPPYLFAAIEEKIARAEQMGTDIINLGIGDPDRPTPEKIIKGMTDNLYDPVNHQYSSSEGLLRYRQAVAGWYRSRFGVELNPAGEIVSLLGSKEGLAHIPFAFLNAGDISLVPDPGYPVYRIGTLLAGGEPYSVPLKEEHHFLPSLCDIPAEIARKAKLLFINYPNNPTGAVCGLDFFAEVVDFAEYYDILVCHDAAYSEICFDGFKPPSFLQAHKAKQVGVEFHSLSKTYNMTGWRIGWMAGNSEVVEVMKRFKSNVDSGIFQPIQYAAVEALEGSQESVAAMQDIYQRRRDIAVAGLRRMGWTLDSPRASFYLWAKVPRGYSSTSFAEYILDKAGVVITPGNGYGSYGEGYFRLSLTVPEERIDEALKRMYGALGKANF